MKTKFIKVFCAGWLALIWFGFVGPAAVSAESTFLVAAWCVITSAFGMWAIYDVACWLRNINKGGKK